MKWFGNKIRPSFTPGILTEYFENTGSYKNNRICNAPFSGLYFTPDGLVKPCCAFSDSLAYGYFPKNSIGDILNAPNRKALQKHMNKNNLSFGCQACLKNISSGNYRGSISSLYQKYKSAKYPEVIDFELSHFCNLDCEMCYLHTKLKVNNEVYGNKFLEEIKPYLSRTMATRFYGGEPFLIKIYHDIWNLLAQHNKECQVHIQTNGTIFNKDIEDLLNKLNIFLGISIDAITPSLYEQIRKGADYNKVMEHTQRFNEIMQSQGKSLTISFCPMPQNWQEIPAIFEFANQMKSMLFFNTVNFPSKNSLSFLSSSVISNIAVKLDHYLPQHSNNPHQKDNILNLKNFIQGLFALSNKNKKTEQDIQPQTLRDFFQVLAKRADDEHLISCLKKLMENFDMNMPVSPYLQANIRQLDKTELVFLLDTIIKNKNITYLKNIFQ